MPDATMPFVLTWRACLMLTVACAAACASSGVAPAVSFSIALADGRSCRDASLAEVIVVRGETSYAAFVCEDAEAPSTVSVDALPLTDSVSVLGLSAQGAVLYRGAFTAADLVGLATAAVVELYADAAR